jgi:hypothetical protein
MMIAWFWAQTAQAALMRVWVQHAAVYEMLLDNRTDGRRLRLPSLQNQRDAARAISLDFIELGIEVPQDIRQYEEDAGLVERRH